MSLSAPDAKPTDPVTVVAGDSTQSRPGMSSATSVPITLTLTGLPPNPNQLKGKHWGKIHASNKEWKETAGWVAKSVYRGSPLHKARIHYIFSVGDNRVHDADNLIASTKPITDGLKGIVIEDDSIDHVSFTYEFNRDKPRQLRIEIHPAA
jgi:hypothetical protein